MGTIEGFEEKRRALFAAYGFDGKPVQLADSAGRESYALARTNGSTPTVLVYGGVADGAEWAQLAASIDRSVVILDRPGFGLGYPVTFTAGNVRRVAGEWLTGIADGLGVEQHGSPTSSKRDRGSTATTSLTQRPSRTTSSS